MYTKEIALERLEIIEKGLDELDMKIDEMAEMYRNTDIEEDKKEIKARRAAMIEKRDRLFTELCKIVNEYIYEK